MALRDTFLLMLIPLAAGALILLAAGPPTRLDAAAATGRRTGRDRVSP